MTVCTTYCFADALVGCGLIGCTTRGHFKKSHCPNWPVCTALRDIGHNSDCSHAKTPGCGKEGCTTPGHRPTSHCPHYPACSGLRNEHDDDCPLRKETGIAAFLSSKDATTNWWSMTFTCTGQDVPSSWLKLVFEGMHPIKPQFKEIILLF